MLSAGVQQDVHLGEQEHLPGRQERPDSWRIEARCPGTHFQGVGREGLQTGLQDAESMTRLRVGDCVSVPFQVVEFFDRAVGIAGEAKAKTGKLKDYKEFLESDGEVGAKMAELKKQVNQFALQFPMPGFEDH